MTLNSLQVHYLKKVCVSAELEYRDQMFLHMKAGQDFLAAFDAREMVRACRMKRVLYGLPEEEL